MDVQAYIWNADELGNVSSGTSGGRGSEVVQHATHGAAMALSLAALDGGNAGCAENCSTGTEE